MEKKITIESISIHQLPDLKSGPVNKGFTCTGLTYSKDDDCFYAGNIGKVSPDINGFRSTIVKLSKDFSTNLGEIEIYKTFDKMKDIQGLTIDTKTSTFWFCSFSENMIRCIDNAGNHINSFFYEKPTGIAYEGKSDSLWVLGYDSLCNVTKDGKVIKTINVKIEGQDQIFLDENEGIIYITAGINYSGINYIYKIDLSNGKFKKWRNLEDSHAIEGLYISNDKIYVLNDGLYHDSKVKRNQVNIYKVAL